MINKIEIFFRRVASGSFVRFFRNLNQVHEQSGKNRILLFFDMIYCIFAYGVGYLDYLTFGFAFIKKDKRLTYMTMNDNVSISKRLNKPEAKEIFNNKLLFNNKYKAYLKRDFIDLNEGYEAFERFCENKDYFFSKQPESFGGLGVQKVSLDGVYLRGLYDKLMASKMYLAEEAIKQHPQMDKLCAKSVNTIRIVTIFSDNGNPNFVYALIRIGSGKNDVDNITSGGMYTLLSPEGKITHPTFCDKTVSYYTHHPETNYPFIGFEVPFFKEAVEMCKEASLMTKDMRYVGWDVAITLDGPVFVEGNDIPGYDMAQNYRFHDNHEGLRMAFENALNN